MDICPALEFREAKGKVVVLAPTEFGILASFQVRGTTIQSSYSGLNNLHWTEAERNKVVGT